MLSEDILDRELQEHTIDELIFVRHEVPLFGEPVALLAAEQDTAGRHQDEPIQRHGIPVMDVSEPLDSIEQIAAGGVVTSSTIFSADTDDGMRGEITVDGDSTENAVCQVDPDRSGERDLPFISDLRAGSRYYEKYCEQRYDFLFHVFSEVYSL